MVALDHPRIKQVIEDRGCKLEESWIPRAERSARHRIDQLVRAGAPPDEQWKGFFDSFMEGAGVPRPHRDGIQQELHSFHRRHHLWNRPLRGVPEALGALSRAGYRVAALSNSDGRAEVNLQQIGLAREFEFVLDSAEVGVEKPEAAIFHLACQQLELRPSDCVYVGDILSVDIEGALAAGLRAILLDHYECYRIEEIPENVPRAVEASEILAGFATTPAPEKEEER